MYVERIINELLNRYERCGKSENNASKIINELNNLPRFSNYDAFLKEIKSSNLIVVEYTETGIPKRFTLKDVDEAFLYMNRIPKNVKDSELKALYGRYDNLYAEFMYLKSSYPKNIDLEEERNLLDTLNEVLNNNNSIYQREFSILQFGDSKTFENKYLSKIEKILEEYYNTNLEDYDIHKGQSFVYFKGVNCFSSPKITNWDFEKEGIAIPGETVNKIIIDEDVRIKKVITIENLTTFKKVNAPPSTLLIFLSGYHSNSKRKLLKQLKSKYTEAEFIHFGDIDCGGYNIYYDLVSKTNIAFKTIFMDIETLEKNKKEWKSLKENDKNNLLLLKNKYPEHSKLFEYMLENNCKLEQEVISLANPDCLKRLES